MFCVYWTRDKNIIVNHVANYKETASKSSRKYEKVRGEALADQEMGPGWSINSLIMSPEINLKCTQKQPTTKNPSAHDFVPPVPGQYIWCCDVKLVFLSQSWSGLVSHVLDM